MVNFAQALAYFGQGARAWAVVRRRRAVVFRVAIVPVAGQAQQRQHAQQQHGRLQRERVGGSHPARQSTGGRAQRVATPLRERQPGNRPHEVAARYVVEQRIARRQHEGHGHSHAGGKHEHRRQRELAQGHHHGQRGHHQARARV